MKHGVYAYGKPRLCNIHHYAPPCTVCSRRSTTPVLQQTTAVHAALHDCAGILCSIEGI